MEHATLGQLAVLGAAGMLAGWLNTVAGAGSLLMLPALVWSGLEDDAANATNRLAIVSQGAAAVIGYRRAGVALGRAEASLAVPAAVGAGCGAWLATLLTAAQIHLAVLVAMAVMLVLAMVPLGRDDAKAPLPRPSAATVAGFFAIGVYGGFLQAGLGLLVLLYLSRGLGTSLVPANVMKSLLALALAAISLLVFAARGETIDPVRGGVLAMCTALGALVGARATVRLGERFVRSVMIIAILATMADLVIGLF